MSVCGCAPQVSQSYRRLRPELAAHRTQQACSYLRSVEHSVYGEHSALLYLMDLAMVQFDGMDNKGCIETIERAKVLGERLDGAHPGREAMAWLSNDRALPYVGEDFERVLLHILEALSYARGEALADAQVEARQAVRTLKKLSQNLRGKPVIYQDDAFAHFLAGLLFEADTQDISHNSDARIEYARALQLYAGVDGPAYRTPMPRALVDAQGRVLRALGTEGAQELQALAAQYPFVLQDDQEAHAGDLFDEPCHGKGRLIVVVWMGEAPLKAEAYWEVFLGPNIYKVAYPRFVPHIRRAPPTIRLNDAQKIATAELVMDVQAVAMQNLADHMGRIKSRIIAREVAKYTAGTVAQGIGLERGGLVGFGAFMAGLALNTATYATAKADTRSWATLPQAIYLLAEDVRAGPLTLQVGSQQPVRLAIEACKTHFVSERLIAN